jgi:hypothetical protein
LRGEVTRLRALEQQLGQLKAPAAGGEDPFTQSVLALTQRAGELNGHLQRMPDKGIPELQDLTAHDGLTVAKDASFHSETDVCRALSRLRDLGIERFGTYASKALDKFIAANNGHLPTDPSQLKPYFDVPVADETLQRYRLLLWRFVPNSGWKEGFVLRARRMEDRLPGAAGIHSRHASDDHS